LPKDVKSLSPKCIKIDVGWSSAPDPARGAYIAASNGPYFKGEGGEGKEPPKNKPGYGPVWPIMILLYLH